MDMAAVPQILTVSPLPSKLIQWGFAAALPGLAGHSSQFSMHTTYTQVGIRVLEMKEAE